MLNILIDLQHKYIEKADEYTLLIFIDRKQRKHWEWMESKYNRLIIGINERIIWLMNK